MGDNDVQGESFFTETGQIADSGNAQVLANTEANLGRNAALTQENRMVTEYENGGLTEQEIYNEGVAAMLLEKYPNACEEITREDGVKEVVMKQFSPQMNTDLSTRISLPGERGVTISTYNNLLANLRAVPFTVGPERNLPEYQLCPSLGNGYTMSFSREGIKFPGINMSEQMIPTSFKDFSDISLRNIKSWLQLREKLHNFDKSEVNKGVTLDKLRELL